MFPSRFLSRSLSGLSRASSGKLIISPTSYARVSLSSRYGQWQRVARYATNLGENNSESLVAADEETADEQLVPTPSNGNGAIIPEALGDGSSTDWSKSYYGLSIQPFSKDIAEILEKRLDPADIEMKPGV